MKKEDFYGKSFLDRKVVISKWVWSWKFPFRRKIRKEMTMKEAQDFLNMVRRNNIENLLKK